MIDMIEFRGVKWYNNLTFFYIAMKVTGMWKGISCREWEIMGQSFYVKIGDVDLRIIHLCKNLTVHVTQFSEKDRGIRQTHVWLSDGKGR